ncbi:MAG: hypothetical protein A2Z88_08910 [Omnitrophica WOR_2 bacterium GWA2_47_8]|nr:MAG: hypothetical protein A2Z88_08910 [Omnitrophica WOR_2 bacterium GWA2_47_8]
MEPIKNLVSAEKLKNVFGIDNLNDKYFEYTELKDRHLGFSVKRNYPSNIRFVPPITKNGDFDILALIFVVCETPIDLKSQKIPLFLSISPYSRYLSTHLDYNFSDESCPTEDSVRKSKPTPKPIALEFSEYTYDLTSNSLQDSKNKTLTGEEILDSFFKEHCNTVHLFKGLALRWEMGSRNKAVKLCDFSIEILKWILKNLFGRTFESRDAFAGSLTTYLREDMKLLQLESIDIFGYKASKNIIMTFSIIILFSYILAHKFSIKSQLASDIMDNNLVTICFTFFSIWFLDRLIPYILFKIINLLIRLKVKFVFAKLKA